MDTLIEQFIANHPQQAAHVLESCTPEEFIEFSLQEGIKLKSFLPYISSNYMSRIVECADTDKIVNVVTAMPEMQVATLLKHISSQKRSDILSNISPERVSTIKRLLEFNSTQIGYYTQKPKLVLLEGMTIARALEEIDNFQASDLPIFIVNDEYQLLGTLDLVRLAQKRNDLDYLLKNIVDSQVESINALSPLDSIKEHKAWGQYKSIAVTGRSRHFLGVISIDILTQKKLAPTKEEEKSSVEEYIYFSEMIWSGLNKFWGALK